MVRSWPAPGGLEQVIVNNVIASPMTGGTGGKVLSWPAGPPTVLVMSNDMPTFGYGHGGRPLTTVRSQHAEAIRTVLSTAGFRPFDQTRGGGFVVDDGDDNTPFAVSCTDDAGVCVHEMARYEAALLAAGYRVEPDPDDDEVLQVWLAS